MKKEIIINAATAETRIALLEDGHVAELFVERPETERNVGDIYLGRVRKVLQGISAAFVDIGWEQDAFLHFNDVSRLYEADGDENGVEREKGLPAVVLQTGQEMFVQVIKEPIGGKGPRVTSQISLPGRYVVLVPNESSVGVSRKIRDSREKRRLRNLARDLRPEGFGLIVRTVAEGKGEEEIRRDIENLVETWRRVDRKAARLQPPAQVYKEVSLAGSVLRDLFGPDIDRLIVDSRSLHREIIRYLETVSPSLIDRVELYRDSLPVFDHFQIESEIERGIRRKVWLQGGGHIVIEHTEAMVTIDVNSGRFIGRRNHEENSLRVNLRAAREICRQLRLRDIGGIIVVDFIDMLQEKNRKKVFDEMRRELKRDRAKMDVAPIGPFGLLVLTRQRVRPSLLFTFKEPCPTCHGTGMVDSKETVVTELERWIKRFVSRTGQRRLKLVVHPELAEFLTEGGLRSRLNRIMLQHRVFIRLQRNAEMSPTVFRVISSRQKQDVTEEYRQ
ncbi:MAG TPA: Rne/Rng family ribonuclease [Bacteroidetes bacterium]|nr:Rne/Rng family ribonuclease [Bacteroidota bacterium]